GDPLFTTSRGGPMSQDALQQRLAVYAAKAAAHACPALASKKITPHVLRHSGHALAPRRHRHHRHPALARPRKRHHHADPPASRHDPQAASPRPDHPPRDPARPLPAARRTARLPGSPVIMPISRTRPPPPTSTSAAGIGITAISG